MNIETLTFVHVVISLAGILSGCVLFLGFLSGSFWRRWNTLFLVTTVATSATGFLFPFVQLLPSHIFGAISLVVLAVGIAALYRFDLVGFWRKTYVICAAIALYLNIFVGVVQAFLKVPALKELAPTQAEPPFAIAQLLVLVLVSSMAVTGWLKWRSQTPPPRLAHRAGA